MKQETNNEMDLLLRRLARRDGPAAPGAGDHLDADELNAYTENVLPAAARARYTEHLTECARCRELVVQLSAAAGVLVAANTVKVAEPSALKRFLASLFSPMVLRYAAPALGLIVVAAIGIGVLRRQRSSELVTQIQQNSPAPVQISKDEPTAKNYYDNSPQRGLNKPAEKNKSTEPAPAPNSAPAVTVTATPAPQATPQTVDQIAVASEPPPPAKDAPKPAAPREEKQQEAVRVETTQRAAVESATPAVQSSADKARSYRDDEATDQAAGRNAPARRRGSAAAAPPSTGVGGLAKLGENDAAKTRKTESKEKSDSDSRKEPAETRSVAGRTFRKDRGMWIDTAYNSGSTTNLTRGSEQFRALVADEPAIKTIADQLDGEIIVVWKGRAYRIR